MTDDLVKRLRWRAESNANCLCGNPVCDEAADRIEKLEATLREIRDMQLEGGIKNMEEHFLRIYSIVGEALEEKL